MASNFENRGPHAHDKNAVQNFSNPNYQSDEWITSTNKKARNNKNKNAGKTKQATKRKVKNDTKSKIKAKPKAKGKKTGSIRENDIEQSLIGVLKPAPAVQDKPQPEVQEVIKELKDEKVLKSNEKTKKQQQQKTEKNLAPKQPDEQSK